MLYLKLSIHRSETTSLVLLRSLKFTQMWLLETNIQMRLFEHIKKVDGRLTLFINVLRKRKYRSDS